MQLNLKNLKLKEDLGRVEAFHWLHMFFVGVALLVEIVQGQHSLGVLIQIPLLGGFYYLFHQTKKKLYYSFWTFAGVLALYLIIQLFSQSLGSLTSWLYLWALVILCLETYILSSPIYYPRISWWEYDFRYRDDVKIKVAVQEHKGIEGRLTDVRRGAGCVALFEELDIGTIVEVDIDLEEIDVELKGEVMSKRQYSVGRPWRYGVRFILDDQSEEAYEKFSHFWKKHKHSKMVSKFGE